MNALSLIAVVLQIVIGVKDDGFLFMKTVASVSDMLHNCRFILAIIHFGSSLTRCMARTSAGDGDAPN